MGARVGRCIDGPRRSRIFRLNGSTRGKRRMTRSDDYPLSYSMKLLVFVAVLPIRIIASLFFNFSCLTVSEVFDVYHFIPLMRVRQTEPVARLTLRLLYCDTAVSEYHIVGWQH